MYDAVVPHHGCGSGPLRWRTLAAIGAALVIAACGSDGATPTAPTPKTASVTSVAVTGSALAVGATVQFIATATLSDGSTQNVTTGATWASSNPNVASVTSAGAVNPQTAGDADITAAYNGVTGKMHVALVRPPSPIAVISGTVTDGFSGGILPNISVQLIDSRSASKGMTTDASGSYSVANVATGLLTVSFSARSYVTLTKTIAVSADTRLDVTLQRAGPISGPALLTIHAPFIYVLLPPDSPTRYGCVPSTTGTDFVITGTQAVDERHLTFTAGPGQERYFDPVLTLRLMRTGRQLAGQIGGATNDVISKYGLFVEITDLPDNYGHPANANGGIGADGRASGTMIGTLYAEHINPQFHCSGTLQWALIDQ